MKQCYKDINKGMILRIIWTIFIFSFTKKNYLMMAILLTVLDLVDNYYLWMRYDRSCLKIHHYQNLDKIVDLLSYFYVYYIYGLDNKFLLFILYRLIGVMMYLPTRKCKYLMVFFDFIKEHLVLLHFGFNEQYLGLFIIGKILFEFLMCKYKK